MDDAAETPPDQTAGTSIAGWQFSPRLTHRLILEFGDRKDFDDPRLEWRRLFSELLGTFFLVLVAAGGGILVGKGQISLAAAVLAPGLMVMAIILFMGAVSGLLKEAGSQGLAQRADRLPSGHPMPAEQTEPDHPPTPEQLVDFVRGIAATYFPGLVPAEAQDS